MTIRDIVVAFGFEVDKNSEKQAESSIKGIKNLATKLLGVIGIGFSIAGLSHLAETAADAGALKSQFSQVFEEMEEDAATKLAAIEDDTGVLVNRMKSSFTQIAAFAKTTGLDQAESLEIADRAMKAVTDSAAFYDRSIEDATETMRSFLKGNYENDAALGLSATETTRNTAANKLYGKSFKDLSEAEKQFTLLSMVEEANRASGALGQAARESDTWTNQLGNLKQSVTDLKAAAGSSFLKPAVYALKILNSLVQKATSGIQILIGENGALIRSFGRFHALVKRIQPAIDRMSQVLSRGIEKGIELTKGIVNKFGGIENVLNIATIAAAAFFAVIGVAKIMAIIKTAGGMAVIFSKIAKVFSVAHLKMLGIVAVIVILALILEDFVHFMLGNDSVIGDFFDKAGIGAENARQKIIKAWGNVKAFLLGVWEFIKQAAAMFVDTVDGFFARHGENIRQNFERAWRIIRTFLSGIWTVITQLATRLFGKAEKGIGGSQENIKDKVLSIWKALFGALSAILSAIFEIINFFFNAIASVIETVFSWIQIFWRNWGSRILSWFEDLWNNMGGAVNGFLEIVKGVANFISSVLSMDWQGAWEAVKQIFIGAWDVMTNILIASLDTIKMIVEMALAAIKTIWESAWNIVKGVFSGILTWIENKTGMSMAGVRKIFSNALEIIATAFSAGFGNIKAIVSGILYSIKTVINTVMNAVRAAIQITTSVIRGDWSGTWEGIKNLCSSVWDGIVSLVSTNINMIRSVISNTLSAIVNIFSSIWGMIVGILQTVWDTITAIVSVSIGMIQTIIENATEAIRRGWYGVWSGASTFFSGIWNSILAFLVGIAPSIVSAVSGILNNSYSVVNSILSSIKNFFISTFRTIASTVLNIFSSLASGISSKLGGIKNTISTGINSAVAVIKALPSKAFGWGADFIGGLKRGIMSGIQGIISSVKNVANTIKSYLHFSVPDVGPLTDYESWMPDMMKGLSKGISDNEDMVLDKIKGLTRGMSTLMQAAIAQPTATLGTISNRTTNVTQNVNIDNTYNGGTTDVQKAVSRTMKKSATDATTQMARALAYSRG